MACKVKESGEVGEAGFGSSDLVDGFLSRRIAVVRRISCFIRTVGFERAGDVGEVVEREEGGLLVAFDTGIPP